MLTKEDSTNTIINKLENLDKKISETSLDGGSEPHFSVAKSDSHEEEKITKENKIICRLLKLHLPEFFDDIYIPFNFFSKANWNINKILYDSEDILFYNKKYITDSDEERFFDIFNKYIEMLEEIFLPSNKLYIYFKKWTDMSKLKWSAVNTSYLKSLLTEKKYQYISPSYTVDIFYNCCKKYNNDADRVRIETEEHLNQIVRKVKSEIKEFRVIYDNIVISYVYEYPYNTNEQNLYAKAFLNCVILAVLDITEKLINLHVYAIHPIIENIISYYTPLDDINCYDPKDNNNKILCII